MGPFAEKTAPNFGCAVSMFVTSVRVVSRLHSLDRDSADAFGRHQIVGTGWSWDRSRPQAWAAGFREPDLVHSAVGEVGLGVFFSHDF